MKQAYLFLFLCNSSAIFSQIYDSTFNGNGFVTGQGIYDGINMIEIPTDIIYDEGINKLVMLDQFNGDGALLMRLNSDGSYDTDFGTDGVQEIPILSSEDFSNVFTDDNGYRLTGYKYTEPDTWSPFNEDINADGSINTGFGTDGIIGEYSIERAFIHAACQTSEGKYFLAGNLNLLGTAGAPIMSFNADGSFNSEFGFFSLELNELTNFSDITEMPDGRILVVGETHEYLEAYFPIIACFLPEGGLDPSFGSDGVVKMEIGEGHLSFWLHQIAVDIDGNIFAAGNVRLDPADDGFREVVVKFDSNGNIDTGFGTGGYTYFDTNEFPECKGLLISPAGDIYGLTVGHGETDATFISRIYKVLPDGTLDTTFTNGEPGFFKIEVAGTDEYNDREGQDMIMQPDGKLVVLGNTDGLSGNDDFWIARITTNEPLVDVIETPQQIQTVSVFPNPATDFISVKSDEKIQSIKIYDVQGKLLYASDNTQEENGINLKEFSPGIYLLKTELSAGVFKENFFVKE